MCSTFGIGEWYSFEKPGTYIVTGHLPLGSARPNTEKAFIVTLLEADADSLRRACERFTERALDPTDPERFDAAVDLGLVRDTSVSVPYLEMLLRSEDPTTRALTVQALVRLATIRSTQTLINFLGVANDEDHRRIVGLLTILGENTHYNQLLETLFTAGLRRK